MDIRKFILHRAAGIYLNVLAAFRPHKAGALAYKLFSHPRDGRLSDHNVPQILRKAARETLTDGPDVFRSYTWNGDQRVILLVHGWESNSWRWEKFLPFLQKSGCTVVAIDAPGHGLSGGPEFSVPRYADFIRVAAEKYKPMAIVAHSIGGAASVFYRFKKKHPSLKKMVLLGAPCDMATITGNYVRMLRLHKKTAALFDSQFKTRFGYAPAEFTGSIFATDLQLEGLIIHDSGDDIVKFAEGKKLSEAWRDAEFIETTGLGHSMHDDVLYHRICEFLFN